VELGLKAKQMNNANDDKSPLIDLLTCIATDRGYPGCCAPPAAPLVSRNQLRLIGSLPQPGRSESEWAPNRDPSDMK
jgi:hypothetical protein